MKKISCGVSGTGSVPETHMLSQIPIDPRLMKSVLSYYGKNLVLRPAQDEALFKHEILSKNENAIIATPTNSGKSLISYMLLLQAAFQGERVVLIEPLRALAYEKNEELKNIVAVIRKNTGVPIKVTITTGDYRLTDETMFSKPDVGEKQKGQIIIATPERLDALSRIPENKKWFESLSEVVLDEAHLIGDAHRGTTIELLLTFLRLLPSKPRLILMSATISNTKELADWITPCEVIEDVPRYPELSKWVYTLDEGEQSDDVLIEELQNVLRVEGTGAIIFVYQTASAETLAQKIAERLSGKKLKKKDLSSTMESGVAWFHSKLSAATKENVIRAMSSGDVRVAVSTTALAMGINLPATHVFIRDINFTGYKDLDVSDLMQMLGRAGRGNRRGTGVVMLSGRNLAKEGTIVAGIRDESVPHICSQMIPPEREGYFGVAKPDEYYMDRACSQIMGILGRTGSITESNLNEYLNHTFAGSRFTDLTMLLQRLSRWKLTYLDENTNEYQLTRLGKVGGTCYMPPSTVANIGQFIRDLLSDETSGLHLKMFSAIDFLILLCLTTDEMPALCRYSKALEGKIEGYMERLPLPEKSYLYRKWIKTDPESVIGSARISIPEKSARKMAMLATFTAIFLYDLSRGQSAATMDKFFSTDTEELQEKYRDNTMWMLCGMEKLMEVRCFYYHLKENCEASPDDIRQIEDAFKRNSRMLFTLVGNLKFRSRLGELIRGIKRVYPHNETYPGEGTIKKLEKSGIHSLKDLLGKTSVDIVNMGIRKPYADLIIGYVRKRSM